ncbi:MAG: hypothetical protein RI910_2862 [Verrucomicrobiota bacterium]
METSTSPARQSQRPRGDLDPSLRVGSGWFEPEADPRLAALAESLKLLPAEQREVVVLKVWGDLTFDEIGEQLSISPNTAASRWRYAMEALRRNITARTHD